MTSSAPVASKFDYTALDIDTASFVRQQTGEIRALMRRATQEIFEIGQKLIEVKKRLGHGNYGSWLQAEFAWTERTALRFTSVVETFGHQSDMMSDLDFAPTALYTLAAPSISSEARDEAIERAKAGEFISAKKAEEIKQKYSSKTAKTKKQSKITEKFPTVENSVEIIDAELESPPPKLEDVRPQSPIELNEEVSEPQVSEPEAVKKLPPAPRGQWWRLSSEKQTHLLFCGHPDFDEFRNILPDCAGLWLSWSSTPAAQIFPAKKIQAEMYLIFSTSSTDLNLKVVRETFKITIKEASYEEDRTAIITQLHEAPLLGLLDLIGITCTIAEPDEKQCETIVSVWEQLGGKVEKLESSPLES